MDIFGVLLILGVCYWRNFQETVYKQGKILFNTGDQFSELISQGGFPLGYFSMGAAVLSVLSGRFTAKQNNLGNIFGIIIAVTSGTLDYLFGNHSAIITYPITFLVASFATYKWSTGIKIRKIDTQYYLILVGALILAFMLVHLGFYLFKGREGVVFRNSVALIFGLSLAGNISNAFKYRETWFNWMAYNILQLVKNTIQMNFANVVKYIFYMISAVITYFDWRWNGDVKKGKSESYQIPA
jgi:nicotinamide mononucleotide transporter